ncbi:MAG: ribbon-helix-helix domain-containing protein [Coraliomargarita sp.]
MAPRPRKYKNPAQISLRIDLSLLQEIDRRRAKAGVTRSDFINAVLKQHMEKYPKGSSDLRYPAPGSSL